ncbi:hypothetical protein [Microvirga brassicacearum]|uniref:hypothetical protein n=1 Tax=Microvirga brassicacearum TaxID=2580413 RepID=UPI001293D480|nr:hypothetical protein [Microvirga brassicacearum]
MELIRSLIADITLTPRVGAGGGLDAVLSGDLVRILCCVRLDLRNADSSKKPPTLATV